MNQELLNALADVAYARANFFRRTSGWGSAQFLANEATLLNMLSRFPAQAPPPQRTQRLDISLGLLGALFPDTPANPFWDAVNVHLTPEQIASSTAEYTPVADATELCCICQEGIATAPCMRITTCDHHMHRVCANTWFTMSTRCPVCRGDLRTLNEATTNAGAEGSGMHADV